MTTYINVIWCLIRAFDLLIECHIVIRYLNFFPSTVFTSQDLNSQHCILQQYSSIYLLRLPPPPFANVVTLNGQHVTSCGQNLFSLTFLSSSYTPHSLLITCPPSHLSFLDFFLRLPQLLLSLWFFRFVSCQPSHIHCSIHISATSGLFSCAFFAVSMWPWLTKWVSSRWTCFA